MTAPRNRLLIFLWGIGAALALSAPPAEADLIAKLPEVMNPFFVTIADGRMYVVENEVSVHIYTLDAKGVSFLKTFGREGQGPGEFDFIYGVRPFRDHLEIPGSYKLARFSLDGGYQSELAITFGVFKGAVYRLGDGYVARDLDIGEKGTAMTVRLYDKDLRLVKEIGRRTEPTTVMKINVAAGYYGARVSGDRLYVIDAAHETVVTAFDRNGVRMKEIKLPLEPLKITAALKAAILKPLKEGWAGSPTPWAEFEKRLYFPDETPGLDYFDVLDGGFVARTYRYRGDKVEFVRFDAEGRELRRLDLPFTGRLSNGILFCFYQGRYYYLRENPEEEVWELHAETAW
jgi:hypothetical protein